MQKTQQYQPNAFNQYKHHHLLPQERETPYIQVSYKISQEFYQCSLRGGGSICASKAAPTVKQPIFAQLPREFDKNLKFHSQRIIEKVPIQSIEEETLYAFQWYVHNEGQLWIISNNNNFVLQFYDTCVEILEEFLKILPKYLRSSGHLFYQLLKCCNSLMLITIKYQFYNDRSYLDNEKKKLLLNYICEIEKQIEIQTKGIWETGILYELQLLKTALIHLKTNSDEGKKIFQSFIIGLATSLASFRLSDELKNFLQDGANFFIKKFYEEQIQNPIEIYKTYAYFKELKWTILFKLGNFSQIYPIIEELSNGYNQYFRHSKNWIAHYCWIELISDILSYRPQVSKSCFTEQNWKYLIDQDQIKLLPYSNKEAVVNILITNINATQSSLLQNQINYSEFAILKNHLLQCSQSQESDLQLWNQYLEFEFQKTKQKPVIQQQDELLSLIKLDNQFIKLIISQCEQSKEEFLGCNQRKNTLIDLSIKKTGQQQQILINDLKQSFASLEKPLQHYLFSLNEICHYFSFYFKKMNIFKQILSEQDTKNEEVINFINILSNDYDAQLESTIQESQSNWQKILYQISKEELNFTITNVNTEPKALLNGNDLIIVKFFDSPVKFIQNTTQNIEQMLEKCQNTLKNHQFQDFKYKITVQDLIKVQIVIFLQKLIDLIIPKKIQFESTDQITMDPSKWKFTKIGELANNYVESSVLQKQLKTINSILRIQKIKVKQLIKYFNRILDEAQNYSMIISSGQQFFQIKITLKQQQEYIQTIQNVVNLNEKKQVSKQIEKFEQQLQNIKNTICQLQVSDEFKLNFAKYYKMISRRLNAFMLFSEDWKKDKDILLGEYENFLIEINQEAKTKSQIDSQSDQPLIDKALAKIITQLQNLNFKQMKIKLQLQHRKWLMISKDLSKLIESELISNKLSDEIEEDSEVKQYIAKCYQELNSILNDVAQLDIIQCEQNDQKINYDIGHEKISKLNTIIAFKQESESKFQINFLTEFYDFLIQQLKEAQEQQGMQKENEYNQFIQMLMQKRADQSIKSKNIFQKFFENKSYRVRECFLYNLMKIQAETKDPNLLRFLQILLKQFWIKEKDENVRALLHNNELLEMQKLLFSFETRNFVDTLQNEIKQKFIEIEKLEQSIRLEGNLDQESEVLLKKKYEEFDEIFTNVNEMQNQLCLNFFFLKEITKDIKVLKTKIDKLQETVDTIGDDIRKIRGKNYQELLKLRQQKVLQAKHLRDLDSVYVELKTKEYDPQTGQNVKTEKGEIISSLFKELASDKEGEINEFLWDEKEKEKDVFLLRGQAGSGKSRAANMIEEFVWHHYSSSQSNKSKTKWLPLFVSLPQLKDPKNNLFNEALSLEGYQFDKFQIKELLEAIQNNEIKILLILDSYDEMNSSYIEVNLYQTNKFSQQFTIQVPGEKFKMIVTVRTEILKQQNYQNIFYGSNLSNLKEVELLSFTQQQGLDYLSQYCKLNVKRQVKNFYDFVRQAKGLKFEVFEFLTIIKPTEKILETSNTFNGYQSEENEEQQLIQSAAGNLVLENYNLRFQYQHSFFVTENEVLKYNHIQQAKGQEMLTDAQIEQILKSLKKFQIFEGINQQAFLGLQKELSNIWSENKFIQTIKNIQIHHLLQTPFMMEIIVQVLPLIAVIFSEKNIVQKQFSDNFKQIAIQIENRKILAGQYKFQNQKEVEIATQKKQEEIDKAIIKILKMLEDQQFFQLYSLSDEITQNIHDLIINKKQIKINDSENIDIILKSLKMRKITIFDFYSTFVKYYSENQLKKWRALGKVNNSESILIDFSEFQESLALDMTLRQLTQVVYTTKGSLKLKKAQSIESLQNSWEDQYFKSFKDQNYQKVLSSCILINSQGNTYSFMHKSIQEFFVGKYILDTFNKINLQLVEKADQLNINSLFNQQEFNLSHFQYQGTLRILQDKVNQINNLNEVLLLVIKLSAEDKKFQRASSNCLFIMKSYEISLKDQDLHNINISDINIEGLQFHNCNLSGTRFENLAIDSCNFNFCNLYNVEWNNIIYHGTKFLRGHTNNITKVVYFQNHYIASVDADGMIYFWNYQDRKLIKTLKSNFDVIDTIILSNSGKFMVLINLSKFKISIWKINDIYQLDPVQLVSSMNILGQKVFFSEDDSKLIIQSRYEVTQWDLEQVIEQHDPRKKQFIKIEGSIKISTQAFSTNGNFFVVGLENGNLNVYNTFENYKFLNVLKKHNTKVSAIVFSKSDNTFASACEDCVILIWVQGNLMFQCLHQIQTWFKYINQFIFSDDEQFLYVSSDDTIIYELEVKSREFKKYSVPQYHFPQLQEHQKISVNKVGNIIAVKKDLIISLFNASKIDNFVEMGNISIGDFYSKDQLNSGIEPKIVLSNFKYIAICIQNIKIWKFEDLKTPFSEIQLSNSGNYFTSFLFSNDEKQLICAQDDGIIQIWAISHSITQVYKENLFKYYGEKVDCQIILQCSYNNLFHLIGIMRKNYFPNIKIISSQTFETEFNINVDCSQLLMTIIFDPSDSFLIIGFQNQIKIVIWDSEEQHQKNQQISLCNSISNLCQLIQVCETNMLMAHFEDRIVIWNLVKEDKQTISHQLIYLELTCFSFIFYSRINLLFVLLNEREEEGNNNIFILNLKFVSNQKINVFTQHQKKIQGMSISDDNLVFVSVSESESIIRNRKHMEIIKVLNIGGYCAKFKKIDSKLILDSCLGVVIIIDWEKYENKKDCWGEEYDRKNIALMLDLDQLHLKNSRLNSLIFQSNENIIYTCYTNEQKYITCILEGNNLINFFNQKAIVNNTTNQILLFDENEENKIFIENLLSTGFLKFRYQDKKKETEILDIAFTKKQQVFILENEIVKLFSETGERLNKYELDDEYQKILFLNKAQQLIAFCEGNFIILNYSDLISNAQEGQEPKIYYKFKIPNSNFKEFCLNQEHSILISYSDLLIGIWDLETKIALPFFQAHSQKINSIAFSLDGETFATGSNDKILKIWNLKSRLKIKSEECHLDSIDKLQFSDGDFMLISKGKENTLRFWDIEKQIQIKLNKNVFNFVLFQDTLVHLTQSYDIFYSNKNLENEKLQFLQLELFKNFELKIEIPKISLPDDCEQGIFDNFTFAENGEYVKTSFQYKNKYSKISTQMYIFSIAGDLNFQMKDLCHCIDMSYLFAFNLTKPLTYIRYRENECKSLEICSDDEKLDRSRIQLNMQNQNVKIVYYDNLIILQIQDSNQIILYLEAKEKEYRLENQFQAKNEIFQIKVCKKYIICLDKGGIIYFWDISQQYHEVVLGLERTLRNNEICIIIEISQNGNMLASGYNSGILKIFNIQNLEFINEISEYQVPLKSNVEFIQFSLKYNIVTCLSNEFIWFFHLQEQQKSKILRSTFKCQKKYFFHPTKPLIYLVENHNLKAFHIYDSFNYQELKIEEEIGLRKFSSKLNFLFYDNRNGNLKIFDIQKNQEINKIKYAHSVEQMQISLSDKIVAIINKENCIEYWEIKQSNSVTIKKVNEQKNKNITSVAITPDEQMLVFGNQSSELFMMAIATSNIILQIPDLTYPVKSIVFTLQQQIFALGLNDGTILLYSFNHKEIDPISQLKDVDFKLNYQEPPICVKIFGRAPQLLATGCSINENTKIMAQNKQSLLEVFASKSTFDSIIIK